MLLDVSRFRTGTEHLERRFEAGTLPGGGEDFRIASPVELTADLRKDEQKIHLTGHVTGTLEFECSRCLEPYQVPVEASFETLLLPLEENRGDGEREVAEDDLGVSYYKDQVIDLGEIIREQFYLALPMKPLCREDCRGLCPVCGKNRNRETCTCQTEWVDPRLEPLRKLRR